MSSKATKARPVADAPINNSLQIPVLDGNALLPKLCSLDVSFNRLTSLKNVNTAKELRELKAYNNKITTLRFLKASSNLEGLLVHENQIDEIAEDLLALVKLKSLWLNGNRLAKVQHLGACRLLVHLDLSRNRLTGAAAEGLESLSSLEYLNLSGNQISSLGNLTHLTKLEELNLSSNRVVTLEGGLLPANLSVLRLNENKLASLQSFPPYLTKLNELYLQDNSIAEIGENAAKFPALESLDLRNNRIRSVSQLKSGLANCSSLVDLWIQGNPCCLSQTYLLEVVKALPELRTLDSMSDSQLKAQMEALKNGVITQDTLLASLARPTTPLSSRPGSASSYRPMTPSSAGSSRPSTPDRAAPVFHKPSARSGALLKVATPQELDNAHAEVAERLQSMKAMLGRIGKTDLPKTESVSARRSRRATTDKTSGHSFRQAVKTVEPETLPDGNQGDEAPVDAIEKAASLKAQKPRSRGVDAGTDPIDSLIGNREIPSRAAAPRDAITPRRATETQTPRAPVVVLPPAPVTMSASGSLASPASASKSQLVDAAAMTTDNQANKEEADGATIERGMKELLLAYATPRDGKGFASGEPQDEDGGVDVDGGSPGMEETGESPRIASHKLAEQRQPPNPRSRQGYRTFRVPARLRGSDSSADVSLLPAPVNAV